MRTMFSSKTHVDKAAAKYNASMIKEGRNIYLDHLELIEKMRFIDNSKYISIPDLYNMLGVSFTGINSKRKLYEGYSSGVIVGAGSGSDCSALIGNKDFLLVDLEDTRMHNFALGYECGRAAFNSAKSPDGSTLTSIDSKHVDSKKQIKVRTIDSLQLTSCEIISIDAEGSGIDVLAGSVNTIYKLKPDILLSIYHNWVEYLLSVPMLYDMGYEIMCIKGTNMIPNQPQLDLCLFATYKG